MAKYKTVVKWGMQGIIITVKGLNSTINRQGLSDWTEKQNPTPCCFQESHLKYKGTRGV